MVKVVGPLFSLSASGTFRREITFSAVNGNTIASGVPKRKNQRTPAQQAQANSVAAMSSAWSAMSETEKQLWKDCGQTYNKTGYKLFWSEWFLQNVSQGNNPVLPC